ncbi:MAG: hypothetical protein IT374_19935 [Polyangiaceae bacterium]|nr:hypothetical protein [Polyangiaceae bacterium]
MELLGPFGLLFWVGLAVWVLAGAAIFVLLGRYGGLDRSRTLSVVFDDDSPMKAPGARRDRVMFRVAVFAGGFGLMTLFTGLSVGDARDLRVCTQRCQLRGYPKGKFAPSAVDKGPDGKPARGCFCVGPMGTEELRPEPPPSAPR